MIAGLLPVQRQKYIPNTGKHCIDRTGQEKLFYADLMACIAYVCEYNATPSFVVVAGGAPGVHFIKLVKMLPLTIQWHLYAPETFHNDLAGIANVYISNCTRRKTAVNGSRSQRPSF
jgi:hypothetical protein